MAEAAIPEGLLELEVALTDVCTILEKERRVTLEAPTDAKKIEQFVDKFCIVMDSRFLGMAQRSAQAVGISDPFSEQFNLFALSFVDKIKSSLIQFAQAEAAVVRVHSVRCQKCGSESFSTTRAPVGLYSPSKGKISFIHRCFSCGLVFTE